MKTFILIAATALTMVATTATAQPTSTTVSYADLDLASEAGQAALARRIATAADMVCGVENGTTDLASHIAARLCRAKAVATTMLAFAATTGPQYASR